MKIADIVFAFNNSELIHLLRQRGAFINNQQFDKMREVEKKISESKNENYSKLTKPVCVFITFEEEDGYIIAQKFEPQYSLTGKAEPALAKLMNHDLFVKEATEPTNIIWENRHFTSG